MLIKAYIGKTTASLMLENIPAGEQYTIKYFNTNEAAYRFVKRTRERMNSIKLLANLGLY